MGFGKNLLERSVKTIPTPLYCKAVNLRNILRGHKLVVEGLENGLFKALARDGEIYFSRRNRYFYYKRGISARLGVLANDYLLRHIPFEPKDHVVDCGANIGEVGIYLKQFGVIYHGFEPEEKEAQCCDLNNFNGEKRTIRKALWKEETTLKFYSKPDTADSSAFAADDNLEVLEVEAVTLENYMNENKIDKLRFAKIEAEGAEPEVLAGAQAVLHRIDYIAVDCGFERGKDKEATFFESNEILRDNEFEIIDANLRRNSFLFRRRGVEGQFVDA
ncbi:MAG: FkbM family methyltransferase [Rhizobiaceae bacterium]|nr:FkbM family methyltransferase [Rhizobiaceae bacterium]